MPLRKAMTSFIPNRTDDTNSAIPVVSMISAISFPLIVVWRRKNILTGLSGLARLGFDDSRQLQQFRADGEAGFPRSLRLDFKTNFIPFLNEIDDSASLGKPFGLADGEDLCLLQFPQKLRHARLFRRTDEKNLARLAFREGRDPLHDQFSSLHHFAV